MQKPNILQKDYTSLPYYYQLKLPIEKEYLIPADGPVRLLSAFVEGMDLSEQLFKDRSRCYFHENERGSSYLQKAKEYP